MELTQVGKLVAIAGAVLLVSGVLIMLAGRLSFIGNLPGDVSFRRGNTTIYFPIVTMILVSIILTVVLNLLLRR